MNWILFVIIQMGTIPVKLEWPAEDAEQKQYPSIDVDVKNDPGFTDANINLHMDRSNKVYKMIGVAADTTVNTPTTATIEFASEKLCNIAAEILRKQPGVCSVSCIQVR